MVKEITLMPVSLHVFCHKPGILSKRPDPPSNFSLSKSYLVTSFYLLEFWNNFVDMCPNSCIMRYLNEFT